MKISAHPNYRPWFGANALAYHIYAITYLELLPLGAFRLGLSLLAFQFAWHIFSAAMAFQMSKGMSDRKFFWWTCLNSGLGYFYGKQNGFLKSAK